MRPVRLFAVAAGAAGLAGLLTARGRTPSVTPDSLSGASGTAPAPDRPSTATPRARVRAWAELLRVSALFTVPGDALAGAAAAGRSPNRGTALAVGASLCLYEAGMALNDWADREEDAIDRPHRPIPSGRIAPGTALAAAGALTATGLALAARAGRPAFAVATGLAATVWAYDLHLKHTKLGPTAMATARALDLLLGATATMGCDQPSHPRTATRPQALTTAAGKDRLVRPGTGLGTRTRKAMGSGPGTGTCTSPATTTCENPGSRTGTASGPGAASGAVTRPGAGSGPGAGTAHGAGARAAPAAGRAVVPAALLLGAHTYAVTAVSRHEAQGGSTATPLAALAATVAFGAAVAGRYRGAGGLPPVSGRGGSGELLRTKATADRLLLTTLAAAYLHTGATPLLHAALNPSPPLTQRAVGGGIRAMIPLQAALAVRAGAPLAGLAVMGLVPLARTLARKVSPT